MPDALAARRTFLSAATRDVTAVGLIQNGMFCSRRMVPSRAIADRAESVAG